MPSKTQKQANFMQHCAHDESYAAHRGIDPAIAKAVHEEDIAEELFGKTGGGTCPKCEELSEEDVDTGAEVIS